MSRRDELHRGSERRFSPCSVAAFSQNFAVSPLDPEGTHRFARKAQVCDSILPYCLLRFRFSLFLGALPQHTLHESGKRLTSMFGLLFESHLGDGSSNTLAIGRGEKACLHRRCVSCAQCGKVFYSQLNFFSFLKLAYPRTQASRTARISTRLNAFIRSIRSALRISRFPAETHPSRAGFTIAVIACAQAPLQRSRHMLG